MAPNGGLNAAGSQPRKSRGRGLRTKTGCLLCRQRHLKCDETKPKCQNCARKDKTCFYASESSYTTQQASNGAATEAPVERNRPQSVDIHDNAVTSADQQTMLTAAAQPNHELVSDLSNHSPTRSRGSTQNHTGPPLGIASEQHVFDFTSPVSTGASSVNQPIGVATAKWFDMLAEDANLELNPDESNGVFQRYGLVHYDGQSTGIDEQLPEPLNVPDRNLDTLSTRVDVHVEPEIQVDPSQVCPWRCNDPLGLERHEEVLLAAFITHISQWIDLFDPYKHFAALVPRLALHNFGLMNAILALSARHNSVAIQEGPDERIYAKEEALRFYHESLHYVRTAMQYTSYHTSEELLATTLIISAYEMLDGSSQDWQRHLQGVFWIQRSQTIHGDSGGLKGAVWWAWLCQDIWAAFRSKRKVFTFWEPAKAFPDLEPTQLAARAVFLLGRTINYCFRGGDGGADLSASISERLKQADSLNVMLNQWESCLTPEFLPLPYSDRSEGLYFKPIWIHPPVFASAMQFYHTCRLLICLHQPSLGGFQEDAKRQTILRKHTSAICGIASMLTDYGSSIASFMCVFIAGMCIQGQQARSEVLTLLEASRMRTGWPVEPLSEELKDLWHEL